MRLRVPQRMPASATPRRSSASLEIEGRLPPVCRSWCGSADRAARPGLPTLCRAPDHAT
jgi:hypothetical protein